MDICRLISPKEPTFPRAGSTLDHFLVSSNLGDDQLTIKSIPTHSEHNLVELTINLDITLDYLRQPPNEYRNYKKVNWIDFHEDVNNDLWNINLPTDKTLTREQVDEL